MVERWATLDLVYILYEAHILFFECFHFLQQVTTGKYNTPRRFTGHNGPYCSHSGHLNTQDHLAVLTELH